MSTTTEVYTYSSELYSTPGVVSNYAPATLSNVSVFGYIGLLFIEHCYAIGGLVANVGQQYDQQTQDELNCQKMSNEVNEVLVNLQNKANSEDNPNVTASLPDDVVDYINDNEIVITGVTDGGENGSFSPISTDDSFNEGQLQAIKGQFDIMSTEYSDSNSKYQLQLQAALQALTQSITAISQTMSKSNQVISQIISNFK